LVSAKITDGSLHSLPITVQGILDGVLFNAP
jgi:hypothetical protein